MKGKKSLNTNTINECKKKPMTRMIMKLKQIYISNCVNSKRKQIAN
jgi:hypothetical protein